MACCALQWGSARACCSLPAPCYICNVHLPQQATNTCIPYVHVVLVSREAPRTMGAYLVFWCDCIQCADTAANNDQHHCNQPRALLPVGLLSSWPTCQLSSTFLPLHIRV
jgi:hypothetical protein